MKDVEELIIESIVLDAEKIMNTGDKENANKNSCLVGTKKDLCGGLLSKQLMLKYELPKEVANRHIDGYIYIHDLDNRYFQSINCCLFDMGNVLKDGFTLNGYHIEEPDSIETAIDQLNDIIQCASSQQYGGFTVPNIDEVLSKYAKGTYNRLKVEYPDLSDSEIDDKLDKILFKKFRMLEIKINCVNNSQNQTPFVTFTFGLGTDKFSRMISKAILHVRMHKLDGVTALFPKLVLLHRSEINGDINSPNYDIKELSIKCSMDNLYPDYLSLDGENNYLREVYDRCGTAISGMGCRAYLSPYWDEEGRERYVGRFNIGCVTLGLVRYAIESKGDMEVFYKLLDDNFDIAMECHKYTYDKLSRVRATSNPLMFMEGGSIKKLKATDTIESLLPSATASIGYIGLHEAVLLLSGKGIHDNQALAIEILQHLRDKVEQAKVDTGHLIALYGTPSEGLCDKYLRMDREKYGVIPGVTDKDYYMNSFHIDVTHQLSALEKQAIEEPLFHISSGGRIHYSEFPKTSNYEAILAIVNAGMKKGLYLGVNIESGTCHDCKAQGDFKEGTCYVCGSSNITVVDRCCGYLGYHTHNGDTRYNKGKKAEVNSRVKHFGIVCK